MANKKEKEPTFNWRDSLHEMEIPQMLKAGIKYYIEINDLTPKNNKDLEKIIDDYSKIKLGE